MKVRAVSNNCVQGPSQNRSNGVLDRSGASAKRSNRDYAPGSSRGWVMTRERRNGPLAIGANGRWETGQSGVLEGAGPSGNRTNGGRTRGEAAGRLGRQWDEEGPLAIGANRQCAPTGYRSIGCLRRIRTVRKPIGGRGRGAWSGRSGHEWDEEAPLPIGANRQCAPTGYRSIGCLRRIRTVRKPIGGLGRGAGSGRSGDE